MAARLRAERLSKKFKEAFIIKTLEVRKKKSRVFSLSEVIKQSIKRQETIKSENIYKRNRQNICIEEFINKLDQVNTLNKSQYSELTKQMESIEKEIKNRNKAVKVLSGKMSHLLRPIESNDSLGGT